MQVECLCSGQHVAEGDLLVRRHAGTRLVGAMDTTRYSMGNAGRVWMCVFFLFALIIVARQVLRLSVGRPVCL